MVVLVGDTELLAQMDMLSNGEIHNDILFFNTIDLALQAKAYRQGNRTVRAPQAKPAITPTPTTAAAAAPMPRFRDTPMNHIGGLFASLHRGIDYMSWVPLRIGAFAETGKDHRFERLMQGVLKEYPEATFHTVDELNVESIAAYDLLILRPDRGFPLSAAEQRLLFDYVSGGGCAVLSLADPNVGRVNAEEVLSLVAPFGLRLFWPSERDPAKTFELLPFDLSGNPLLDGAWGQVDYLLHKYPVGIIDTGPYGEALIQNKHGDELLFIPPDAIAPGSGPVVTAASASTFVQVGNHSFDNDALVFNTIDYCHQQLIGRTAN